MTVCIIPARGGSRRIPRKNIRDFKGQPMLAHAIRCAQASDIFNRIIVSTDDDEIAAIARNWDADVHYRKPDMAQDNVGTQAVMKSVVEDLLNAGTVFEVACCLYPCVPLLKPEALIDALEILHKVQAAYVFSVGTDPLHDAGQFYIGWTDAFLNEEPIISPVSIMYPIPKERDCDINTEADWKEAEMKFDALCGIRVH
jgi:N-acylneuraminate cytidylyltransferase